MTLDTSEERSRSIISTQTTFIQWKDCKNRSSISGDIRLDMPIFAVSYQMFTYELCQQFSYWTKVHKIFTWYRGIIDVVNVHIDVAIFLSILGCQSNKWWEFAIFFTKLVSMTMSFEISVKEVHIDHLHNQIVITSMQTAFKHHILRYLPRYAKFCCVIQNVHKSALSALELLNQS